MGVDREVVQAFAYLFIGVIALVAGTMTLLTFSTGNTDVTALFVPLFVSFSAFVGIFCIGLAAYGFIRSRTQ